MSLEEPQTSTKIEQEHVDATSTPETIIPLTAREERIKTLLESDGVTFEAVEKILRDEKISPPTVKELMRFLVGDTKPDTLH